MKIFTNDALLLLCFTSTCLLTVDQVCWKSKKLGQPLSKAQASAALRRATSCVWYNNDTKRWALTVAGRMARELVLSSLEVGTRHLTMVAPAA